MAVPAGTDTEMVTAGVMPDCLAMTSAPFSQPLPRGGQSLLHVVGIVASSICLGSHAARTNPPCGSSGRRQRAAASATWSRVTLSMRRPSDRNRSTDAIVWKYPSWCATFVTLSFSNTRRARSWFFAFSSSSAVIPSRDSRSISASAARFHRLEAVSLRAP